MPITEKEYCQRLVFIRQLMRKKDLDALIVYSWKRGQVTYISGYWPGYMANMAMVIIPQEGELSLLIRLPFDLERAKQASWIDDIRIASTLSKFASCCTQILGKKGFSSRKVGFVGGDATVDEMPYSLLTTIKKDFPQVEFLSAFTLFEKARFVKSKQEINILKNSALVADLALENMARELIPGKTEYELIAIVEKIAREKGGDEFLAAITLQAAEEVIGPPQFKKVKKGDVVIVEFALRYQGYWTQVARTFAVEGPSPEQREIYQAVRSAYQAALSAAKPDNPVSQVAKAAYHTLASKGYKKHIQHDFGHGIGLDLPEKPSIRMEERGVIQPGMVLVIHPAIRKKGSGGAFLGGTVVVTKKGATPLHKIPEHL